MTVPNSLDPRKAPDFVRAGNVPYVNRVRVVRDQKIGYSLVLNDTEVLGTMYHIWSPDTFQLSPQLICSGKPRAGLAVLIALLSDLRAYAVDGGGRVLRDATSDCVGWVLKSAGGSYITNRSDGASRISPTLTDNPRWAVTFERKVDAANFRINHSLISSFPELAIVPKWPEVAEAAL